MVSITFFWRINCKTSTKKMKRRENMLHVVLQVAAFTSYVFFDCFQSGWARLPHAALHSVLSRTPEVDEKKEWKNERMNRLCQQVSQESRCSDCKLVELGTQRRKRSTQQNWLMWSSGKALISSLILLLLLQSLSNGIHWTGMDSFRLDLKRIMHALKWHLYSAAKHSTISLAMQRCCQFSRLISILCLVIVLCMPVFGCQSCLSSISSFDIVLEDSYMSSPAVSSLGPAPKLPSLPRKHSLLPRKALS